MSAPIAVLVVILVTLAAGLSSQVINSQSFTIRLVTTDANPLHSAALPYFQGCCIVPFAACGGRGELIGAQPQPPG